MVVEFCVPVLLRGGKIFAADIAALSARLLRTPPFVSHPLYNSPVCGGGGRSNKIKTNTMPTNSTEACYIPVAK